METRPESWSLLSNKTKGDKMKVKCPNPKCDTVRDLVRDRGTLCRMCSASERREALNVRNLDHRIHIDKDGKHISQYKRVCKCGDSKWVGYYPEENQECRQCSASKAGYAMSQNNIKRTEDKTLYKHVCSNKDCGSVRWMKSNPESRKTTLCKTCSSTKNGSANKDKKRVLKKYEATCPVCHETRDISQTAYSRYGTNTACKKHVVRRVKVEGKKKVYKKSEKTISKADIEKAREANRLHRDAQKPKVVKPKQMLTEDEMMTRWLRKNKVTVIPMPKNYQDSTGYKRIEI